MAWVWGILELYAYKVAVFLDHTKKKGGGGIFGERTLNVVPPKGPRCLFVSICGLGSARWP